MKGLISCMPSNSASDRIRPMRIAMLSIHSSPLGPLGSQDTGGMSVYVRELAKWLGQWGHRVDIYTHTHGDDQTVHLYPNVRLVHLTSEADKTLSKKELPLHLNRVFAALETYRLKHGLRYDLIHSHYWLSGVVGALAQTYWQCPHLTMFHTLGIVKNLMSAGENEPDYRIAHERWLAKVADMIIVPAERERNHLSTYYKADLKKIKTISCGVNLDRFIPSGRAASRRKIGLSMDADVVLYVGRFAPLKGIEALFRAVANLAKTKPRLQLLIVGGDGPQAESTLELVHLASDLQIQNRIIFAGRIDQKALPVYYSACDALALPSHYESFGLVVLEALACGLPVLATPVGAVEDIIQPRFNGDIIRQSTPEQIAEAIERILPPNRAPRPDPWQIRSTVDQFGWDRISKAILGVYNELVNTPQIDPLSPGAELCCSLPN